MSKIIKQRHFGDRKDAWIVKDLDPMHNIMNYLMGSRTENEAVATVELDMTNLSAFIDKKNKDVDANQKYTFFHVVLAALAKTIKERKCLNYFIRNRKFYERKVISFCYVAKKKKEDGAEENIVIQDYHPESDVSPLKQMHDKSISEVTEFRKSDDSNTHTGDLVNSFLKLPAFILNIVMAAIRLLDKHGRIPYSLFKSIPYSSTVFVTNLGSIKFNAQYHHLINFGSNSVFVIIGEKHYEPKFNKDGSYTIKEYLPITFTIDERIADGVYFAKSLRIFQALLMNPELLDKPANENIDFIELLNNTFGE